MDSGNKTGYYVRQRWYAFFEELELVNCFDTFVIDFLNRRCGYGRTKTVALTEPPVGVWIGTATDIAKIAGKGWKESQVRDSLRVTLCPDPVGLVKVLSISKSTGKNAYVLDDFEFRESGKLWHVNAQETTDWRKPVVYPGEGQNWKKRLQKYAETHKTALDLDISVRDETEESVASRSLEEACDELKPASREPIRAQFVCNSCARLRSS